MSVHPLSIRAAVIAAVRDRMALVAATNPPHTKNHKKKQKKNTSLERTGKISNTQRWMTSFFLVWRPGFLIERVEDRVACGFTLHGLPQIDCARTDIL